MSKLIVEVCIVDQVSEHLNADRLEVATIKGWKTCIKKGSFKKGDRCIFFPPDSILPLDLAKDRLGIMNYLAQLPKGIDGIRPEGGRVRATRLRGSPSYGVIMDIDPKYGDDPNWAIGTDVAEHFGITKWEPPQRCIDGDDAGLHPRFYKYVDIENYGNFPHAIPNGTDVVITEKIHGTNTRLGLVLDDNEEGNANWIFMAGSHNVRRKEFNKSGDKCKFWQMMTDDIKNLLIYIRDNVEIDEPKYSIIIFGEMYGSGVQDLNYGLVNGEKKLRVFDIAINNVYIDYFSKKSLCEKFNINMVPFIAREFFSSKLIEKYTSGKTLICEKSSSGKFGGREGIVITPVIEQHSKTLNSRMILKSVCPDYLGRKGGTDGH